MQLHRRCFVPALSCWALPASWHWQKTVASPRGSCRRAPQDVSQTLGNLSVRWWQVCTGRYRLYEQWCDRCDRCAGAGFELCCVVKTIFFRHHYSSADQRASTTVVATGQNSCPWKFCRLNHSVFWGQEGAMCRPQLSIEFLIDTEFTVDYTLDFRWFSRGILCAKVAGDYFFLHHPWGRQCKERESLST